MAENESPHEISAEVADLLQRKGTLEIIVRIGEEDFLRHTDLRRELLMSSSTIQKRLKAGREHGLWDQRLEEWGDVTAKVYALTPLGDSLYARAKEHELVELYQSRREIVRTIQNRERRVVLESSPADADWISDITMEEHDIQHVQKFLEQFTDSEST